MTLPAGASRKVNGSTKSEPAPPPSEGWNRLNWVSMNDKRSSVGWLAGLGLHPILLHGLLNDGACTCGRSECGKSRGKHPVHKNWQTALLDVDGIDAALQRDWHYNIGIRTGIQPCGGSLSVVDVDGPLGMVRRERGARQLPDPGWW